MDTGNARIDELLRLVGSIVDAHLELAVRIVPLRFETLDQVRWQLRTAKRRDPLNLRETRDRQEAGYHGDGNTRRGTAIAESEEVVVAIEELR